MAVGKGGSVVVSIPAWCDWEDYGRLFCKRILQFQFQLGAIGSFRKWSIDCRLRRFNSSLVRLGGVFWIWKSQVYLVSIPAWCDWENKEIKVIELRKQFQFQLGAIGSK